MKKMFVYAAIGGAIAITFSVIASDSEFQSRDVSPTQKKAQEQVDVPI